jgi:hypothetical protein
LASTAALVALRFGNVQDGESFLGRPLRVGVPKRPAVVVLAEN